MPSVSRAFVLSLALGTASAASAPSVDFGIKAKNVGKGFGTNSISADATVESQVSDNLSVGANVGSGDSPLKSVFAKISQKFNGGTAGADLTMGVGGDNSVSGDVSYTEGGNKWVAGVSSASGVDTVKYTKSGAGFSFSPTFRLGDKNMDLQASADYSADTNVDVKVGHDGAGALKVKHRLDADTALTFKGTGTDVNAVSVEASRCLDADNTIKPKFDLGSKHLSVGWTRKVDAGRSVTLNVDPENSVGLDFEGAGDEDWKASVTTPWGDFKDADVSFGRKFNF